MRKELLDTMVAIRLPEMEISHLTMELSDLGQEITKGVRSSTQVVSITKDRLVEYHACFQK
ncbi:transmembrane protein, partial [Thalictrum thalictroides]